MARQGFRDLLFAQRHSTSRAGGGGPKVLIDVCEAPRAGQVERRLAAKGLERKDIDLIVCTHGHADHCGSARYFQEKCRIPVAAGRGDLDMMRRDRNGPILPIS